MCGPNENDKEKIRNEWEWATQFEAIEYSNEKKKRQKQRRKNNKQAATTPN